MLKKVTEVIAGFFIILWEILVELKGLVVDAMALTYATNKRDNKFIELMCRYNFLLDFPIIIGAFIIIGSLSVTLGIIASFVTAIVWYNIKASWYKRRDMDPDRHDNSYIVSSIGGIIIPIIFSIYTYTTTPYTYDKVGSIFLADEDIHYQYSHNGETKSGTNTSIDVDIDNKEYDVWIRKCSEGTHTILKEHVTNEWFTFISTEYMLDCSNGVDETKKLIKDGGVSEDD